MFEIARVRNINSALIHYIRGYYRGEKIMVH